MRPPCSVGVPPAFLGPRPEVGQEAHTTPGRNSYSHLLFEPGTMPKDELLPGVITVACPPAVSCDAKAAIRAARRRALGRDLLQVALLIAVDFLFFRWPEMRLPFLERHQSLRFLEATNVAVAVHLWWSRVWLPRWSARRIAATWSRAEQQRFTR